MLWILLTLSAVVSQTIRNVFYKKLSGKLSSETVTLCRFLFGLPVIIVGYLIGKSLYGGVRILSLEFFFWVVLFAIAQILATSLLISLFHHKNFTVSVTYIKSEAIFVAFLGLAFLSEQIPLMGWLGIIIAFSGLLLASFAKERIGLTSIKKSFQRKSSYIGLTSGLLFAITTVAIKRSFVFLETDTVFMKSLFALMFSYPIEVALLLPIIFLKRRDELSEIIRNPKIPFLIGLFSGFGSFFWLSAFSIAYVAYVTIVGKVEFILSTLISIFYFNEKVYRNEILGMAIMVAGVLLLIFT
ncbi:MAG: DMT family transporter [Candidatus Altiarchaeota archaeon]|nr:DMT family transporter [Candidatus Altiarchaeota archaeon]